MNPQLHILFEHGLHDLTPFGSSQIRLIRPFSHPDLQRVFNATFGPEYFGQTVDAVIVDRLWRPRINLPTAKSLRNDIHRNKAKLIYALDDNFLNLNLDELDFQLTNETLDSVKYFLTNADGVIVTTDALKEQFSEYNSQILVVPNMLDERLFAFTAYKPTPKDKVVIGYMGTYTHDADLKMIMPALREIRKSHPGRIEIQVLGVSIKAETFQALNALPAQVISLDPLFRSYDKFVPWFQSNIHWDIGLCPLLDSTFNRCKSDIKHLDYGAAGIPGIYSRVPAYASTVQHLLTGYLADNTVDAWVEGIKRLINDVDLRYRIAVNACDYVLSQRTVEASSRNLVSAIDTILEKKVLVASEQII
jgi:glycosyltransferase involved in cell wall biosynthesis